MPNWSEGVLKIKGTKQDIENFIRNGIDYRDYRYEFKEKQLQEIPVPRDCSIKIDEDDIYVENTMDLYIKGTRRMFVNSEKIETYYRQGKEKGEKYIVYIDIRQAWAVVAQNLQSLSKEWKLDFKIFATEQGMEFCQDIEVVNGEIIANNEVTFDDFSWEAPDPRLGG